MSNRTKETAQEKPHWLDKPGSVDKVFFTLCVVCGALVAADLFYHKKGHFGFEDIIGFHAGYGFIAYVGLILAAKLLQRAVIRDEDYYD